MNKALSSRTPEKKEKKRHIPERPVLSLFILFPVLELLLFFRLFLVCNERIFGL
jgi:hypothetical protein